MQSEIVISLALLFVGIAIMVAIYFCVVSRAFRDVRTMDHSARGISWLKTKNRSIAGIRSHAKF
ncbi:hypothetical protein CRG98_025397 [Punica granatum]|uniref:Uncharacterized protein n=1 Tax=Punica granatum TaxID=22663 RepID=A0A2I0JDB3_PUNGR|nr:hypothetical protein CRG98_025397 [Punica granatum]